MTAFLKALLLVTLLTTATLAHAQDQPDPRWLRRAQQPGIPPLQKKAYEQLALLRTQEQENINSPARALQRIGLDALPVLAEALDDNTPTRSLNMDFSQPARRVGTSPKPRYFKVNELAIGLISRITEHTFVIGEFPKEQVLYSVPEHPEQVPAFQALIREWHARNKDKTLAQRKIADVSDPWFRNRLDAAIWIGQHKDKRGKSALEHYIVACFDRNSVDTTTEAELAQAALALGQIGDKSALPSVQRVWNRYLDYRRGKDHINYFTNYIAPLKLLMVYRSLTLLGAKSQANKDLNAIQPGYAAQIENATQQKTDQQLRQ